MSLIALLRKKMKIQAELSISNSDHSCCSHLSLGLWCHKRFGDTPVKSAKWTDYLLPWDFCQVLIKLRHITGFIFTSAPAISIIEPSSISTREHSKLFLLQAVPETLGKQTGCVFPIGIFPALILNPDSVLHLTPTPNGPALLSKLMKES